MQKSTWLTVVLICATAKSVPQQDQAGSAKPDVQTAVEKLVKMHSAWGPAISTPGMTLTLRETARSSEGTTFRLQTTGTPRDKIYSLVSWPVTEKSPITLAQGVTLNASGVGICSGRTPDNCGSIDKPDDPIDLEMHSIPGEPVRLGLVSSDNAVMVFAKIVPVPLAAKDRGCNIDAVLLTAGAEAVEIEGDGFPPNSELTVVSVSEKESRQDAKLAGADGTFSMVDLPYIEGRDHGKLTVTLKSSKCSPTLTIPWGNRN